MSGSLHSRTSSTPISSGIFGKCFPFRGFTFKIKWLYLIFSSRPSRLSFWDLDFFLGKRGETSKVLLDRAGIGTIWDDLKSDKIEWHLKNIVFFFFFNIYIFHFSHALMSDSLGHHALQHTRLPYPSSIPRACSNSCSSSWWCHATITSSVLNLLLLPSVFHSLSVFSNEPVLHIRWPKYESFIFSISPSNEYSGLISFKIDWFDLFAVQGTLKSLLQHHSSKASILWCSAFFMVQLSHPYMTTGRNHSHDWTDICQQSNVSAF